MSHFAGNLKFIRKGLGWTQAQAAEKISTAAKQEISEDRYQSYERGIAEPPLHLLITIAEVFSLDDLYLFLKKPMRSMPLSTKILRVTGRHI